MLKNFFRHWHYGIKAKVVDNALVAHIDTSIEPVFLRFDLARLQSVLIDITNKNGDYELVLVGVGAPAATTTLARFEVRAAAEEAAAGLRCALMSGNRNSRFRSAFRTTLGIIAAIVLVALLAGITGEALYKKDGAEMTTGGVVNSITQSANEAMEQVKPMGDPGEPQSFESFAGDQ